MILVWFSEYTSDCDESVVYDKHVDSNGGSMEDEPEKNASLELPAARAVLALVVFRAFPTVSVHFLIFSNPCETQRYALPYSELLGATHAYFAVMCIWHACLSSTLAF